MRLWFAPKGAFYVYYYHAVWKCSNTKPSPMKWYGDVCPRRNYLVIRISVIYKTKCFRTPRIIHILNVLKPLPLIDFRFIPLSSRSIPPVLHFIVGSFHFPTFLNAAGLILPPFSFTKTGNYTSFRNCWGEGAKRRRISQRYSDLSRNMWTCFGILALINKKINPLECRVCGAVGDCYFALHMGDISYGWQGIMGGASYCCDCCKGSIPAEK